jgi:hypothetical protein
MPPFLLVVCSTLYSLRTGNDLPKNFLWLKSECPEVDGSQSGVPCRSEHWLLPLPDQSRQLLAKRPTVTKDVR